MTTRNELDRTDRAIINAFQGGFPVAERPFEVAAARLEEAGLHIDAAELRDRIRHLDGTDILSRFGPLINPDRIGGKTTLVAMSVPEERYEAVTAVINEYPEVAHNYERDHDLNMWFVVSVIDPEQIDEVLVDIEQRTGLVTYNMPKCREFYLEATFPIDGPLQEGMDLSTYGPKPEPVDREGLTRRERNLLAEVQDGLPHSATPYADVADQLDTAPEWVRTTIKQFLADGKIRRIGVVPNHYALGYTENAMTVWDVDDEHVTAIGAAVGALPFVTHCYERPRHEPVWPYNFFAMVHGRSESECHERIEQVQETVNRHSPQADWNVLYSTRILKKTGLRLTERVREASVNA